MASTVLPLKSHACADTSEIPVAEFHLGYRRWLDGLRGLAVLLVLAFHLGFLPGGALGVDMFFVLSGFLITNLLAEEWRTQSSISLKGFYFRRALRLLPAFVLLLAIFFVSSIVLGPAETRADRWHELIAVACYVANYPQIHGASLTMLGHTWSLSVEEQFYLLWPLAFFLMLRWRISKPRILIFVAAGIAASAVLRTVLHHQHRVLGGEKIDVMILYMGLHTRADALLIGCLTGLLVTWNWLNPSQRVLTWIRWATLAAVGVLTFCLCKRDLCHPQYYDGLFTLAALAVATLLVHMLMSPSRLGTALLESRPLVGAGQISYGLYLYHIPAIIWLGERGLGWQNPVNSLLITVVTLAISLASFFLVERPFLRLKDRWQAPVKPVRSTPKPEAELAKAA